MVLVNLVVWVPGGSGAPTSVVITCCWLMARQHNCTATITRAHSRARQASHSTLTGQNLSTPAVKRVSGESEGRGKEGGWGQRMG